MKTFSTGLLMLAFWCLSAWADDLGYEHLSRTSAQLALGLLVGLLIVGVIEALR